MLNSQFVVYFVLEG